MPRAPLPVSLNLSGLYDALVTALIPSSISANEDLQARVARAEAIRAKGREIERIAASLKRERQFNKRVAINADLRAAKQALASLEGERKTANITDGDGPADALGRPA